MMICAYFFTWLLNPHFETNISRLLDKVESHFFKGVFVNTDNLETKSEVNLIHFKILGERCKKIREDYLLCLCYYFHVFSGSKLLIKKN